MHRPLKGESRSIAKMRAQYQVGPTRDQYVYSPSMPTADPGVERPNTLGIYIELPYWVYFRIWVKRGQMPI